MWLCHGRGVLACHEKIYSTGTNGEENQGGDQLTCDFQENSH